MKTFKLAEAEKREVELLEKIQSLQDSLTAHKEILKELKDQNKELFESLELLVLYQGDPENDVHARLIKWAQKAIKQSEQRDNL